jgi:hypothetical protein
LNVALAISEGIFGHFSFVTFLFLHRTTNVRQFFEPKIDPICFLILYALVDEPIALALGQRESKLQRYQVTKRRKGEI